MVCPKECREVCQIEDKSYPTLLFVSLVSHPRRRHLWEIPKSKDETRLTTAVAPCNKLASPICLIEEDPTAAPDMKSSKAWIAVLWNVMMPTMPISK